ncbi:arf-GAP with coiled-coil, ANK repeat and PH domain-containing protein 2-like isoform X2 [Corythoichthys intestinalis]|uniref:arf-GAP with coiled-coil, ANK repeat and PH domain-containing protein 2-like isoform X2 n=1 Tax=Corythoichthys intestinalis TaxID=161448 RepID=UPI0025A5EDCF|nr:arf-GAP with coiled-coil, ANK repeat and PH domain-containing protein 2-like isoform X2 [Corythoichthys intestinalis]XP_057695421.1 arf-GAP with coiled-coil, ANK repeat and PH domain-containing protein 2-like isoform X2 [Corythoichthys intestinalis]
MEALLDFSECVADSPEFRLNLDKFEEDVFLLQTQLDKVTRLCGKMVEAGQAYNAANQLFLTGLSELFSRHKEDGVIANCLTQFEQGLQELLTFHTMLLDQSQRAISHQLSNLCEQFLPQLSETRVEFLRIGDNLDTAAAKNAQVSRHKTAEAERASHLLTATRKCYQHFALDYCLQLNMFKTQQKTDILNSVFSLVNAQLTFFHQGFDLLRDLDPAMKVMAVQLCERSAECASTRKNLENAHLLVQQRDASGETLVQSCHGNNDVIQGYLFKRSRRKLKTWKRCWFAIRDNQLIYRKSHKEASMLLFEDLRLCAVKSLDDMDRRFCFQLISVHKCCVLQADSEHVRLAWMGALQGSIDMAYRERGQAAPTQPQEPPPPKGGDDNTATNQGKAVLAVALQGSGNQRCCDCGEEEPRWAVVNLGVTVCIQCSGIHRSLGVHVSKVRSLTLDSWEAEQLKLLCVLGNDTINNIYEAQCSQRAKPTNESSRAEKEAWIRDKYVEKTFVRMNGDNDGTNCFEASQLSCLYRAAVAGDLVAMVRALAHGAPVNGNVAQEEGRTPLIGAAQGGSLLACEFLLLNGANINHRDRRGQGALHAAATAGHTGQVCLLLKRGANQYAVDESGRDPLAIAVETAHADIVTLLRMARMNEEMRDSDGVFGAAGDDQTFQDIFRDFSNMASHDPEKLARRTFSRGDDG